MKIAATIGTGLALAGAGSIPAAAPEVPSLRERRDAIAKQLVKERKQHRSRVRSLRRDLRVANRRAGMGFQVQEALTLASVVYGVPRSQLSVVASCESGHTPTATNGQYLGLFQLGRGFRKHSPYFPRLTWTSPYANALAAAQVVAVQGWRQWQCRPNGGLAW